MNRRRPRSFRVHHIGPPIRRMRFGMELVLDLSGCDPFMLEDPDALRAFTKDAVHRLGMRAFEDTKLWHFGHDDPVTAGYTLLQLIETSSILGHLSGGRRHGIVIPKSIDPSARLNLFSCRTFDVRAAIKLCIEHFGGRPLQAVLIVR